MKERVKGAFTRKKILRFLKMALFVVALSLILLSLLGTVAHATGLVDDTINTENLYSNDGEGMTFDQLFDKLTARTPIKAVFCLEKDYSTKKDEVPEGGWLPATTGIYSGNVIITALEANAPNGDNATFTASFEGVGALTKTATA